MKRSYQRIPRHLRLRIAFCLPAMMMCSLLFCLSGTGCRLASADPTTAFVGDSITQGWSYPAANFGVFGNTTQQILDRLPDELPGHGYKSMVLLAGTNDVLQRVDPAVTIANIEKLAEIGLANGARPVLCEVPPIFRGGSQQEKQTNHDRVVDLNNRIVALAARRQWIVVDYYDPLANHPDYFADGVHLRRRGYVEMELAYLKAIAGS